MRIGGERGQVAHGIAHQEAIVGGERQECRADPRGGGVQAGKPAALDQYGDAAGQPGGGKAGHQLGEGTRPARSQRHVEGAVEPVPKTHPGADPFGLADQQLRGQRRRERAGFRRFGQTRRSIVRDRDRTPIGRGRGGPVDHAAHDPHGLVLAEPFAHEACLAEQRIEGVEQRLVAGPEALGRQMRTLRIVRPGQPVTHQLTEPFAVAIETVGGQGGRPRPAGQHQGLGGDQRRDAPGAFIEQVGQVEPQPRGLASRTIGHGSGQRQRFIGRALEDHVQGVAGHGKGGIEPPGRQGHETVEFFGSHHRAGAVEAQQRDQRAVAADQRAAPARQGQRRLGGQEALQRLAAQGPAQALEVLDGVKWRKLHPGGS